MQTKMNIKSEVKYAIEKFVQSNFFKELYEFIGENEKMRAALMKKLGIEKDMCCILSSIYLKYCYKKEALYSLCYEIKTKYKPNDMEFILNMEDIFHWCIGTDELPPSFLILLTNVVYEYLKQHSIEKLMELMKNEKDNYFSISDYRNVVPLSNIMYTTIRQAS